MCLQGRPSGCPAVPLHGPREDPATMSEPAHGLRAAPAPPVCGPGQGQWRACHEPHPTRVGAQGTRVGDDPLLFMRLPWPMVPGRSGLARVSPPEVWSVERCGGFLGIFGERPRSDRKYPETLHNPPHPPHRARGVFGSARFGRRSRRGRRPSLSGLEGHADQSRGLAVGLGLEEAIEDGLSGADGYRVGPEGIHEDPGTRDAGQE